MSLIFSLHFFFLCFCVCLRVWGCFPVFTRASRPAQPAVRWEHSAKCLIDRCWQRSPLLLLPEYRGGGEGGGRAWTQYVWALVSLYMVSVGVAFLYNVRYNLIWKRYSCRKPDPWVSIVNGLTWSECVLLCYRHHSDNKGNLFIYSHHLQFVFYSYPTLCLRLFSEGMCWYKTGSPRPIWRSYSAHTDSREPPAEFLQMGLCSSSVPVESQHAVFLWNFFLCSTTKKTLNNTFLHSSYSTVYEWMIHESFIVMFMCLNHILKIKKFLTVLNALLWANL